MTPSFTPMAAFHSVRSRWWKCRATPTPPCASWLSSPSVAARRAPPCTGGCVPTVCVPQLEARFWMDEHKYYGIAEDGEGQLCRVLASNPGHLLYVGMPRRSGDRASVSSCSARTSTPAGACARWRSIRCISIRCPITTARSGHMTPRCAWPAWHATASATASCASPTSCSKPRSISGCVCRSCSAALRAPAVSRRSPIRWPVCRRPGPPVRRSCCCRPVSECASTAGAARSRSISRGCRLASTD